MTDRQTGLGQYGHEADENSSDGWADPLDDWDDPVDGWDGRAAPAQSVAPPQVTRPWYRDQRWLFGLIGAAAAALVVASVLLITDGGSGQIPTAPDLSTRRPANTTALTPRTAPPPSPTSLSAASSTSELPSSVETPDPIQSAAPAAELPAEPSAGDRTKNQNDPQINVTRTPMSFSPGKR